MYRLKVRPVRIADAQGATACTGLEWNEPCEGVLEASRNIATGLILAIVGCVGAASDNRGNDAGLGEATAILFAALAALWFLTWLGASRSRSLLMHADGRVELPHGLPGRFWLFRQRYDVANILGFQVHHQGNRQQQNKEPTYDVHLYMRDGDVLLLSEDHNQWEAHKIVVMLTASYREIMEARTQLSRRIVIDNGAYTAELVVD